MSGRVRIVHLSDAHFGTIRPGVAEGLVQTVHGLKPDLILLTGDITQRARASQFKAAKAFVAQLKPFPCIAVPGNHDIPLFGWGVRFTNPYGQFKKLFKELLEKDYVADGVRVTGLNSTSRWRHVQGDFNIPRIEKRLKVPFENVKVRIAAFHHPMDCAKSVDEKNLLVGRDETMRVLDEAQVDLVVGGHIHDPHVALSGVRYPAVKRNMILAVAGTCTSWRTRSGAPNSFNLIDVETETEGGPTIGLTRYDMRENKIYTPELEHRFQRDGERGWRVR
jgi:3',5'-cyclic AMP phosphodiesterase CpdA